MLRVLAECLPSPGELFHPAEEERSHLAVRRVQPGEECEILDGRGGLALGRVQRVGRRSECAILVESWPLVNREWPGRLVLYLAMPVALEAFERLVPQITALGIHQIQLFASRWSGRLQQFARMQRRYDRLVREAMKQCGRLVPPLLAAPLSWPEALACLAREDLNLAFHPAGPPLRLADRPPHVGLWIGPEAGLDQAEVAQMRELGAQVHGLGPLLLRLETAALGTAFWLSQLPLRPS
jgi:16S rRNA (uracil1498-N3)-methyltransferase